MINKYFNADAAEVAGGGGTPNIAELMARHGVVNSTENQVATPIVFDTEKKEEPVKQDDVSSAVTATETSNVEKANLDTPSPEVVAETKPTPQQEVAEVKQQTWQEVLKNQQPDNVLKELGYDENAVGFLKEFSSLDPKMQAFLNVWKSGGDIAEYLREMTTDYSTMSAEDVMRHQLQREYPKASKQQLDVLFKREIVKAFSLDSDDEDELAEGKALLEAKAEKYRDAFIADQKNKVLPAPPQTPDNSEAEAKAKAEELRRFEDYKSQFTGHNAFRDLSSTKSFSFGEGEEKFNFPVDPESLKEVLFTDKWKEYMFDGEGKPNVEHQLLMATINKYGINFLKELSKHYKSIGGQKAIEPIENASKPDKGTPSSPESAPQSAAEAMARYGRLT